MALIVKSRRLASSVGVPITYVCLLVFETCTQAPKISSRQTKIRDYCIDSYSKTNKRQINETAGETIDGIRLCFAYVSFRRLLISSWNPFYCRIAREFACQEKIKVQSVFLPTH